MLPPKRDLKKFTTTITITDNFPIIVVITEDLLVVAEDSLVIAENLLFITEDSLVIAEDSFMAKLNKAIYRIYEFFVINIIISYSVFIINSYP